MTINFSNCRRFFAALFKILFRAATKKGWIAKTMAQIMAAMKISNINNGATIHSLFAPNSKLQIPNTAVTAIEATINNNVLNVATGFLIFLVAMETMNNNASAPYTNAMAWKIGISYAAF